MRIPGWLIRDVRSAFVSLLVSLGVSALISILASTVIFTYVADALEGREKIFVAVNLNQAGVGYPAVLFSQANENGYSIQFDPPALSRVGICEYYPARGDNYGDLALEYLAKYNQCFELTQTGEKEYRVRPNVRSGLLTSEQGQFFCKCE